MKNLNLPRFVNEKFNFYAEVFAKKEKIYIVDILDEDVKNDDLQSAVEFKWFMFHVDIIYKFLKEILSDKDKSEKTIKCFEKAYKISKLYNVHDAFVKSIFLVSIRS